ncbi:MAG: hypothetical protein R6V60_00515 [Desulfobacterales bacterium]|jgi:hypothetical protein
MHELSFIAMLDNGGRRLWSDRRKKSVPIGIPERRSGKDRRTGIDRRGFLAVEVEKERRRKFTRLTTDFEKKD